MDSNASSHFVWHQIHIHMHIQLDLSDHKRADMSQLLTSCRCKRVLIAYVQHDDDHYLAIRPHSNNHRQIHKLLKKKLIQAFIQILTNIYIYIIYIYIHVYDRKEFYARSN